MLQKKAKDTGDFIPMEFNPLTYKIYKCPLGLICKLDPKLCLNYHNKNDKRRNPYFHKATLCPNLYDKNKKKQNGKCKKGDNCEYAHNLYEYYYHPDKFRTVHCPQEKNRKTCDERLICPYNHETDSDCGKNGNRIIIDEKLISDYYKSLMVKYEQLIDKEKKKLNKIDEKYLCYICGNNNALNMDEFYVDINEKKIICEECAEKNKIKTTSVRL